MIIEKTVTKEVTIVDDILCNKCGESLKFEMNYNGLVGAYVVGGYDSPVLADMATYRFDLCEACLQELFDSFKLDAQEKGGH